ncbi:uncharacterized protein [Antedon mediterranea]|uniref:uncharacterized protein n=1 Tax=Antedon mediterranea TaxID=105859 RepID=UPI003AF50443
MVFYSDSRVVLGYISNQTRRFYVYVSNRVERIIRITQPAQWRYIESGKNPADLASRGISASDPTLSEWMVGPAFLRNQYLHLNSADEYPVQEEDPEVRPVVHTYATVAKPKVTKIGSERFQRFSDWFRILRAVSNLVHITRSFSHRHTKPDGCKGWDICASSTTLDDSSRIVIGATQRAVFADELEFLESGNPLPKSKALIKLDPFIDGNGLLRVGGRLKNAGMGELDTHPIIGRGSHHVSDLIIQYYHAQVQHQGKHFTRGAIRSAGYWIVAEKRRVDSIISKCIKCRKRRGKELGKKMADLPAERLSMAPPFTYVGLDVFGPWIVSSRKTIGGMARAKRWAVLFTCMSCRVIHIEITESMDTSSFINALRRFLAIRGPVGQIQSDCGTNFMGACNEICILSTDGGVKKYLLENNCAWLFNPPHSSHMGGTLERMIGICRRILDSMFADLGPIQLSHEVLTTLMAEVTAIVNSRPLTPIPSDPQSPDVLTPNMILTQKSNHVRAPLGIGFTKNDLVGRQWRRVQYLADTFWSRWKKEYLPLLHGRRKWHRVRRCLKEGDLILMKEKAIHQNNWPMARVTSTFESSDKLVRKVELKVSRDGSTKLLSRPSNELVLLIPVEDME